MNLPPELDRWTIELANTQRIEAIAAFGFTKRQARFLVNVLLHADSLHDRCDRLRREHAGGDDVSRRNSERVCAGQRLVDLGRVPRGYGDSAVLERLRLLDVLASGVEDVPGDDDAVSAVLIEESIDLEVERVSRDVPDDLVDPDALPAKRITWKGAPKTHHENRVARDRAEIDIATERHGDARLEPLPVERVDDVEVVTVRGTQHAIGIWMCETAARIVAGVLDGENVGGKGAALGCREIEQREDVGVRLVARLPDQLWPIGGRGEHQDRPTQHESPCHHVSPCLASEHGGYR
jgi:hypothetical protein